MINAIAEYFNELFRKFEKPQTYGSALEAYIASHKPTTLEEIDCLQRDFDRKNERNAGWMI